MTYTYNQVCQELRETGTPHHSNIFSSMPNKYTTND